MLLNKNVKYLQRLFYAKTYFWKRQLFILVIVSNHSLLQNCINNIHTRYKSTKEKTTHTTKLQK